MAAAASGVTAKEIACALLQKNDVGPRAHLSAVDAHPERGGKPLPRLAGRYDAIGNLVQGTNIAAVVPGEVCLCWRCMLLDVVVRPARRTAIEAGSLIYPTVRSARVRSAPR